MGSLNFLLILGLPIDFTFLGRLDFYGLNQSTVQLLQLLFSALKFFNFFHQAVYHLVALFTVFAFLLHDFIIKLYHTVAIQNYILLQQMDKDEEELLWQKDTVYGFDYVVYRKGQNENEHTHSIAVVKDVKKGDKMEEMEVWGKIANSVSKELWLRWEGRNDQIRVIKYFNKL